MGTILKTLTTLNDTVGHWRFQDNLLDISGNNNTFTASVGGWETYTTGITQPGNTAIVIPLANSLYILAANATDFDLCGTDLPFTVEIWVKRTGAGSIFSVLIGKGNYSANTGWYIQMNIDGSITSVFGNTYATGTTLINDGNWHHITVVYIPNDDIYVYIDGTFDTQVGGITTVLDALSTNLTIGSSSWDGEIDEVCITARELSASEILIRAQGHTDPNVFSFSGSADTTSNVVDRNLNSFDIKLQHPCNHQLSDGQYTLTTCPRCVGLGTYYDIKFNAYGRPDILSIEDKLQQSLEKMILTSENVFHTDTYVDVKNRIGSLQDDVESIISYDIQQAIATLKQNQRSVTNLSPRAQISTVDSITVFKDAPTSLRWRVELTTVSGENITLTGTASTL